MPIEVGPHRSKKDPGYTAYMDRKYMAARWEQCVSFQGYYVRLEWTPRSGYSGHRGRRWAIAKLVALAAASSDINTYYLVVKLFGEVEEGIDTVVVPFRYLNKIEKLTMNEAFAYALEVDEPIVLMDKEGGDSADTGVPLPSPATDGLA